MRNERRTMPPLDLDFERADWTPDERAQMMRRYEVYHGTGDCRLVKFAPFQIDNNPGGFKRYRQYITQLSASMCRVAGDPHGASDRVKGLMMIHLYASIGNGPGCLYEIIGYRMHGLTKSQIREALGFAFLNCGPYHTNDVADAVSVYLDAWHETADDGAGTKAFPTGWKVDPQAFRSGIDTSRDGMSQADVDALASWHRRMERARRLHSACMELAGMADAGEIARLAC